MKRTLLAMIMGLGILAPAAALAAGNDALVQKLVDKGTLTSQEAEEIRADTKDPLKGFSLSGVAFVDYSVGQTGGATRNNYNRFTLQRVYVNIKKEITPWLKVRVTPDIKSGSTVTGDYTIRMKYAYADFFAPDLGPVTNTDIRAGLGHTPYLDFEEGINGYRMQGSMFQDRRHLITSSDIGVSVLGNLGGKLTKEQTAEVGNHHYNGRFGTFHLGVYNGGGYSATAENNQNKSVQARVTLRPLPDVLPGLQFTYLGITGKGNASTNDTVTGKPQTWTNNTGMVTFQHRYAVLTAEYMSGKGANGGDTSYAKKKKGYSVFGKVTVPMYDKVSVFARYDDFDPDKDTANDKIKTTIGGVSYRIHGNNYIMAAYEKTQDKTKAYDDKKGQVVLQLAF